MLEAIVTSEDLTDLGGDGGEIGKVCQRVERRWEVKESRYGGDPRSGILTNLSQPPTPENS